jgi:hypothetical protein
MSTQWLSHTVTTIGGRREKKHPEMAAHTKKGGKKQDQLRAAL